MREEDLSPAAKKLLKLCEHEKVTKVLEKYPGLMAGLDEYVQWLREESRKTQENAELPQAKKTRD